MDANVAVVEDVEAAPKPKRQMLGLAERLCRNPVCREAFTPTWRHQEFHVAACREEFYHPLDVDDPAGPERIRVILSKLEYDHSFFRAAQKAINSKQAGRGNKSAKRKRERP